MNDKDRLQICWQAFSTENSLLQSYRALFMAVEAALLAFAYVLRGTLILVPVIGWKVPIIWVGAGFGWGVVAMWMKTCEAKGRDVNKWRDRIVGFQSIVEEDWSLVGKGWFDYLKPGVKWSGGGIARILFNYVIPISIGALWIFIVLWCYSKLKIVTPQGMTL